MPRIKNLLAGLGGLVIAVSASAQARPTQQLRFHSIENVGLLNGEEGAAIALQTINGVSRGNWFAGLGIGIDYYKFRSVPVFFDLRRSFGAKRDRFFVYGDAGYAATWATKTQKQTLTGDAKFDGGFYWDAGAGYRVGVGKNHALSLSAGFSQTLLTQKIPVVIYYFDFDGIDPAETAKPKFDTYKYSLNRLSLKIGWIF